MTDEIIEIKPGIGPFKLNIVALVRRLREMGKNDPVVVVAQRFLELFQAHGVSIPQIPRLLPKLTLDKLRNVDSLLPTLTNDIIDDTVKLFGVRRQWLDGVDDRIYETLTCYKQPHIFFEEYSSLILPDNGFAVRVLSTSKALNRRHERFQQLALVFVEKAQDLDGEEVNRYKIFCEAWDWSYPPSRIQLKAMARIAFLKFQKPIPIFQVKPAALKLITDGKYIPHQALQGCLLTNPSLEDYALSSKESVVAKEIEELPDVLDYIDRLGLSRLA
jgi:hypothetical protein